MYAPNINGSFTAKPSHALPYYPIPAVCSELHMYSMLHAYHWTEPSDLCIQRGGGGVCVRGQRRLIFHMGIFLPVLPYMGANSVISSSWAKRILYPKYICSTVCSCSAETKLCYCSSGYNCVSIALNLCTS